MKNKQIQLFEANFLDGDKIDDCGGCIFSVSAVMDVIDFFLDEEAKRRKKEKLETAQVNFEAGKNSKRLDVSTWRNIGKKCGYWKYFEKEVKKELLKDIRKKAYAYDEKEDIGVVDFKDIIKIIKESK